MPRRSRGFSLMEIMVVVAIIGLVSAMVLITFSSNRRDTELDQEAERLDALFSYVREQAELQTRDYGFRINDRAEKYAEDPDFSVRIRGDSSPPATASDSVRTRRRGCRIPH